MRRVPIRMKLAGALAVPLLALVVVTALEVLDSSQDARVVHEQVALAEASVGPVSVLSHLENERNAAAVYLLGAEDAFALPVEDNAAARTATDAAVATFRSEVESRGGAIESAYRPALDQLETLGALRDEVDAATVRNLENIDAVSVNFDGYSAAMDPLFEANKRVALAVDDPELRRGAELIDLSARQTNLLAILVRDLLLAGVGGQPPHGVDTPQEIRAIASGVGQLRANERNISTKSTGIYADLADMLFADESVQRFPEVVDEAIATGQPNLDDVILHSAGEDPETFGYTVFRKG
ncbi:MAG: nitrate- and nitrite sensing domain-containing protein, partial [Acidimicrobiales bacterium]|nr:nitrate- and nitrite sensing domain-containing protein [Acidimicrobiales bacterium]